MIKIDENCYLVDFSKKDELCVGGLFQGKTISCLELYYLEGEKYLKIITLPNNFVI